MKHFTFSSHTIVSIFLLSGLPAAAANLPFYPQTASLYTPGQVLPDGLNRVKVSLSSEKGITDGSVSVGNITLCSTNACYRPNKGVNTISLYDTHEGKSELVVDFLIPNATIISVHFEDVLGNKTVAGILQLTTPLTLGGDFRQGEVFAILNKNFDASNRTVYQPLSGAGSIQNDARQSVYYNPSLGTTAQLPNSTVLDIPANSTDTPQILSIVLHDTGDKYPLVDVYPQINFRIPATITTIPVPSKKEITSGVDINKPISRVTHTIQKTGVIRFESTSKVVGDQIQSNAIQPVTSITVSCPDYLSSAPATIDSLIKTTGSVYLSGCVNSAPYVHIAVTDLNDSREHSELGNNNDGPVALTRIEDLFRLEPLSQIMINGFYWTGDTGIVNGGNGYANGYVGDDYVVLGNNIVGGGFDPFAGTYGNSSFDTNKYALRQGAAYSEWKDGTVWPLFSGYYGSGFTVSSSTPILKNGVCSLGAEAQKVDSWSALGTNTNGRMFFISSASGTSTSATNLCPIFQALGVNNAIRLDGSTSAGILIDGKRKNPITGMNYFIYGSSRYIAYAVAITYSGVVPPPTPEYGLPGSTIGPPNCKVNPQSCS